MPRSTSLLSILAAAVVAGGISFAAHGQTQQATEELDPGHREAARAFIDATGAGGLTEQLLDLFRPRVVQVVRQHHPDVSEAKLARFMELFTTAFRAQRPVFRDVAERIFAGFISREDLEAGAAFYGSPAGRGFVEARPRILEKMKNSGGPGASGMSLDDIAPHLSADEREAYEKFVDSDLGKRLAEAQNGIRVVWSRYGAQLGRRISGQSGAMALKQMEAEGNGL